MGTATDLVLIATHPGTHKLLLSTVNNDAILGGAHLLDLVKAGRIGVEGNAKKAKVFVVDGSPVADPEIDAALARIRDGKKRRASDAVGRMGKNGVKNAYRRLCENGQLRPRNETFLGFPLRRHDVIDLAGREGLRNRVRACLLQGQPADGRTGPLIGLLHASDQLKLVVDKHERKQAKAAAAHISEGDWASAGVKDAIAATQTALMVAVFVPTMTAASSGS
ncbi:GPP34 family phosphoprotein [Aeromicrobium phragmitis]|uniref:GPP34 family phosphoprotein n=1 Tax=Aeromicrobium phragmitis TaxID=2478914 RepID=A0A3L8PJJ2_9ACTN|nr:GPP34 family phosphoprotein [Aeromicrobium phragmitis]RLV54863.1 GPP34 family phosphoprotein [Aeromicrobium phragmitis]